MSMDRRDSDASRGHAPESAEEPQGISRRALLKGAASATLAAAAGAVGLKAQVTGLMPGGGTVPFRLPLGSLTYLDRKE